MLHVSQFEKTTTKNNKKTKKKTTRHARPGVQYALAMVWGCKPTQPKVKFKKFSLSPGRGGG